MLCKLIQPIIFRLLHLIKCLFRFVKAEYMRQLDIIAPDYLSESYKAQVEKDGVISNIQLKVSHIGVYYATELRKDVSVIIYIYI